MWARQFTDGLPLGEYLFLVWKLLNSDAPHLEWWAAGTADPLPTVDFTGVKCSAFGRHVGLYRPLRCRPARAIIPGGRTWRGWSQEHRTNWLPLCRLEAAPPKGLILHWPRRLIERGVVNQLGAIFVLRKPLHPERCQLIGGSGCVARSAADLKSRSEPIATKLMKKAWVSSKSLASPKAFSVTAIFWFTLFDVWAFPNSNRARKPSMPWKWYGQMRWPWRCFQSCFFGTVCGHRTQPDRINPEEFGHPLRRWTSEDFVRWKRCGFTAIQRARIMKCWGEGLRKALYIYMHGIGFDQADWTFVLSQPD